MRVLCIFSIMKIDLHNNVVLVTGATGGIGSAIVELLGEYGATIAIHYHKEKEMALDLAKKAGNNSKIFKADLSRPIQCVKLIKEVLNIYNRLDALVNNAGIYESSPINRDIKRWLKDWNRAIDINLTSVGVLCREAVKYFIKSGGGRIINIASRAAFRGEDKDHWAYGAAKGGVITLTRTIAKEYGKYNIKSFAVAPGFVKTRMIDDYIKRFGVKSIIKQLALNELTTPQDVAPVVLFLVSGYMDHTTGSTIDINAGSYIR
uniref:SDR family oxidoreductase n=1 Tax=candidate division WOR-3 bacterium TaxID=2052148 RepID=A0A7C6AGC1_UNCW3